MDYLRLIIDPPRSGPMNMAIDETLLESAANDSVATLRLYQWSEPTLSLGYFQAAADRETHQPSLACPLVRRASGGGAILHDRELTYSVALPEKSGGGAASRRLYELCHATLISVFDDLGLIAQLQGSSAVCENAQGKSGPEPFLCFQRRTCFDVVSAGIKIVGSAQRRRRGAIIQHGSILLGRSDFAPELPGIQEIAGKPVTATEVARDWPSRLASGFRMPFQAGFLTAAETVRSETLCTQRFAAREWVYRR
jgi:lipoate-protein ligase A